VLPALRTSRPDLSQALSEGGRARSAGRATPALMDALVVGQLALAMVVVAGLEPEGVWVAQFTIPAIDFYDGGGRPNPTSMKSSARFVSPRRRRGK